VRACPNPWCTSVFSHLRDSSYCPGLGSSGALQRIARTPNRHTILLPLPNPLAPTHGPVLPGPRPDRPKGSAPPVDPQKSPPNKPDPSVVDGSSPTHGSPPYSRRNN
jgi:hypothetical protein